MQGFAKGFGYTPEQVGNLSIIQVVGLCENAERKSQAILSPLILKAMAKDLAEKKARRRSGRELREHNGGI